MEGIPEVVKNKLLELDAENRQLHKDLERAQTTLKCRDDMLAELEEENQRLVDASKSGNKGCKDTSAYDKRIADLMLELEEAHTELSMCQKECERWKTTAEMAAKAQEEDIPDFRSPTPTEVVDPKDSEEYMELLSQKDDLVIELAKYEHIIQQLNKMAEERVNELENVYGEVKELQRLNKEHREVIAKQDAELFQVQNNVKFHAKGNSMFGEFVDERQKLEKEFKELYEERRQLKLDNNLLTNELEEANLAATRRYATEGINIACRCGEFRLELTHLRDKLTTADKTIQQLQRDKVAMAIAFKGPNADPLLRAQYGAIKQELEGLQSQLNQAKTDRTKFMDQASTLQAQLTRSEHANNIALEDVEILQKQIRLMKERQEALLKGTSKQEDDESEASPTDIISQIMKRSATSTSGTATPAPPAKRAHIAPALNETPANSMITPAKPAMPIMQTPSSTNNSFNVSRQLDLSSIKKPVPGTAQRRRVRIKEPPKMPVPIKPAKTFNMIRAVASKDGGTVTCIQPSSSSTSSDAVRPEMEPGTFAKKMMNNHEKLNLLPPEAVVVKDEQQQQQQDVEQVEAEERDDGDKENVAQDQGDTVDSTNMDISIEDAVLATTKTSRSSVCISPIQAGDI